ncbi:MAG: tetratricopeptide repeat protein [Polyangiales bacterium]
MKRALAVALALAPALHARADAPRAMTGARIEAIHYLRDRPELAPEPRSPEDAAALERLIVARERDVRAHRDEAIALLERFVADTPEEADEMPDALLRLAELRWETARADALTAFRAWQDAPAGRRAATAPRADHAASIALHDRLIEKHPRYARLDLVLYMKALALMEADRTGEALPLFERILAGYPTSKFRPDAHMALAEHQLIDLHDFAAALAEYDQVLAHGDTPLADVALFKSGWCLWQLRRRSEAALRFRKVLDAARAPDGRAASGQGALKSEALAYLIQVFVEDERNRAADVEPFLKAIGGERHLTRVLAELSDTYYDQARYDRGVEAYALLLAREPDAPRAPERQRALARGHLLLNQFPEALAAYRALVTRHGPGSAWAKRQGDPARAEEAWRDAEIALREEALGMHERGQKDGDAASFERAAALYHLYLEAFPRAAEAQRIAFHLGDVLLHRLARPADAGDAYLEAVALKPEGELARDALDKALDAFEQVHDAAVKPCGDERPCIREDSDARFAAAVARHAALYPSDDAANAALALREARLDHAHGRYDVAARKLEALLAQHPRTEAAREAGELLLDGANRAGDYAQLERHARVLKDAPAFDAAGAQTRLDGVLIATAFKRGEQLAEAGAHREAAEAYGAAAREFPKDPRAVKARYNAALELSRAGDLAGADAATRELLAKHPQSREAADAALRAANMYEAEARFREAGDFYRLHAERFPSDPKADDTAHDAVVLLAAAGAPREAAELGAARLARQPSGARADALALRVAEAQRDAGKPRDTAATYRALAARTKSTDVRIEAHTRLGALLIAEGDYAAGEAALRTALAEAHRHKRLGRSRYFAAQARYLQAERTLAAFDAVKIEGDPAGLGARLAKKASLLGEAAKSYGEVVEFREPEWVTAALHQIGAGYERFAKALNDAPLPEGLSEDDAQLYRDELARFVVPIEERALSAFEGGYQKARALGISNRWTAAMREALTRLNEVAYPSLREIGVELVRAPVHAVPPVLDAKEAK